MIPSSDRKRGYSIHLTQNIGIISNTSSQGEVSYRASRLHVPSWQLRRWHWPFPDVEQSETTCKENLPHKDCVQTMPWRQQDSRCTESGGVHNYAWEISPPASLLEKSKKDWITSGMQSMDQPCQTSARRKTNLQTVRGAYRDNNCSNRRKEKSVNWIKDLPKWTKSTGSRGST